MMYRVSFDFHVTRRQGWASDPAAFHHHIEQVRELVAAYDQAYEVRAIAEVAASRMTLSFAIAADDARSAMAAAVKVVHQAIDGAGARRLESDSVLREASIRNDVNSESLTPVWRQGRVLIAEAA